MHSLLKLERISRRARRKVEPYDWSILLPRWEELLGAATGASG